MNRVLPELQRLYLPGAFAPAGSVRALVMELARPASWEVLGRVWRGVQTEFGLPAPAIAVSGTDGLQLWFSLTEPVEAAKAEAFLERLRVRFLPDITTERIRLSARDAVALPALQPQTGNWSAFVAPDLAPVFDETPWLDIPPGDEGQAALLQGLKSMARTAFESVLNQPDAATPSTASMTGDGAEAPERFLRRVMDDPHAALALRIEAAKALLLHSTGR